MNELTPLTSKSGESEWPYKGKTLIAVKSDASSICGKCVLRNTSCSKFVKSKIIPDCLLDFNLISNVILIYKPAEK